MKTLTSLMLCFASVAVADDFKTNEGKEYKNVTVSRVEPDGIVLTSSSGISKVYFTELPKEVQERFHYDQAKSAAYSAQQNANLQALRKQQQQAAVTAKNNKYAAEQLAADESAKSQRNTETDAAAAKRPQQPQSAPPVVGGCLGVTWGMSRAEARNLMAKREGVTYDEQQSSDKAIYFTGGTFAEQPVDTIALDFFNDQFYEAVILIKPQTTAQSSWRQLVDGLTKKYGKPTTMSDSELLAVWDFPSSGPETESVACHGDPLKGRVNIFYENKPMAMKAKQAGHQNAPTKDL